MRPINKFMLLSLVPLSLSACSGAEMATTDSTAQLSSAVANKTTSLTLSAESVDIFHKHSATINATIKGVNGTVDLRLVAPDNYPGTYSGPDTLAVALKTNTAKVMAKGTTLPLTLVASGLPNRQNFTTGESDRLDYTYTVIASQKGKEVGQATITVNEKLLSVVSSFEPASIDKGSAQNVTLVLKVTPPLTEMPDMSLVCLGADPESCYTSGPLSSATVATDGTWRRPYSVNVPSEFGGAVLNYYVYASDFIKPGDQWYGPRYANLNVNQP